MRWENSPASRSVHQTSTITAAFACRRPRRLRTARWGSIADCRSRWDGSARPRRCSSRAEIRSQRVLLRERYLDAPPGPRSDLFILRELARRLGAPALLPSEEPEAVFDELRRASAGGRADYSGVTYARLRNGERLVWPVPAVDHPGTPALFTHAFPTADGRAAFIDVNTEIAGESPDERYPWTLTTGRVREHYNSGTQTRRVARLVAAVGEPYAEIHPALAAQAGISDGDMMRISSRRASVAVRARVTETIRPELIFAPFHWGGHQSINALVGGSLDPHSKMPPFKRCAVRIEAVAPS
jgi:assimilatory nitrate reductase catalytic subunit